MGKKSKRSSFYDRPHVYVATPAYDGKVDSDYSQSLAEAAMACAIYGINFSAGVMGNGAFIDLARNLFCRIFLKDPKHSSCTHLFFIDSDLKFEARAVVELVRHCTAERPVLAGAYRRRQDAEDYPIKWAPHPELSKDGIDKLWITEDGWLQCDRVATGFLCIRRNVIEEMAADSQYIHVHNQEPIPKLFYTFIDENDRFVGEDFAWCDDYLKKYNKKIEVWPDFDFVHGGYSCNYQKWLKKQVDKVAAGKKAPPRKLGGKREGK